MWIDCKTYDDLRFDVAKYRVEARVLSEQNRALQTTMDWFRVRINQLEMERAQLLFNYTGVKVPSPNIVKESGENPLATVPHWGDIGDKEAAALGISWDQNGEIKYASQGT